MSSNFILRLDPISAGGDGDTEHRQAPTSLQLRQQDGGSDVHGGAAPRGGPSLILGGGGSTCIFDPNVPESLVELSFDGFAHSRGWIKATLLRREQSSTVQVNGQPWTSSRNNKRPHLSSAMSTSNEHRYLKHGDTISLLNGHYTYRISMFREQFQATGAPTATAASIRSARSSRSPVASNGDAMNPLVAQAVAAHLSRRNSNPPRGSRMESVRGLNEVQVEAASLRSIDPHGVLGGKINKEKSSATMHEGALQQDQKSLPTTKAASDADTTDTGVSVSTKSVDRLQDDVQCSVCLEIQVHSQTLVPCGHSFCAPCVGIHNTGTSMRSCPNCRQAVRQKIPNRQLDDLISTLVQVPGLLDADDVEHYHKRKKDHQAKLDAAKIKAASAKRPAKRSRTGRNTAQVPRALRDRRRDVARSHAARFGIPAPLSGALHPSISVASAVADGLAAEGADPDINDGTSNATTSARGRPRGGTAAPAASGRPFRQPHDLDAFFREADMELFRQRASWGAPAAAAAPDPAAHANQASITSLSDSLVAAAAQAQHQAAHAAAVASSNRDYMLAAAAASRPGGLYSNSFLQASAPAPAPRYLDEATMAALFPSGLSDAIFID